MVELMIDLLSRDTMQSTLFEPTNLPKIEPSGSVSHVLFEEPMMGMVIVCMIGIMVLLVFRFRGKLRWGIAALTLAGIVAGGLFATSVMVTTDREVLSMRVKALVQAVATGDQSTMLSLMAEHVDVQTRFVGAKGRDRVVSLAASRVPKLIESHSVPEVRTDLPGPRVGRTMVKVRVQGSMAPSSSWWMIFWERADPEMDDWQATHIEPVWIQGVNSPAG